jgi:dodecin
MGDRSGSKTVLTNLTVQHFNVVATCIRVKSFRMSDHVYKKIELVGSSPKSIEAAVENALARAKKTIRNMRWLEITETRGHIQGGKIDHWQVAVKVGFTLED